MYASAIRQITVFLRLMDFFCVNLKIENGEKLEKDNPK
jgi:hypothetical protein